MEVLAPSAALSPHSAPRRRKRPNNVPWRLLRVDERQPAGEIEDKYGTCVYFDSMGPREFMAYAVLFARMFGLGMLSIYGGAAATLKNLRQRHLAHCRELNDLGEEDYKKIVMVAIHVHHMGHLVADGKQHKADVGIEENWIECLCHASGKQKINRRPGGSGSYPDDKEKIFLYACFCPSEASEAPTRCLMRRAFANGTYSSGDGRTWGRWTLDALLCVERHGSAPRAFAAAPVWPACVEELAGMGITKTARARAESLGRLRRNARFEPGSLVDSTQENACCIVYSLLAEQDDRLPVHVLAWLDAEGVALREHVESHGPGKWGLCAERVSAVDGSPGRSEGACASYYRGNVFVAGADGAVQAKAKTKAMKKARRPRRHRIARPASLRSSQAEATRNRLLKKLEKEVEARLVRCLGTAIPKAHLRRVCLRDFKAALQRVPRLPEAQLRSALLGLTKAQIDKAEDDVRREMATDLAKADADVAAAAKAPTRKRAAVKKKAACRATPAAARTPTAAPGAAPLNPSAVREVEDIVAGLTRRPLTRAFFSGKHFAVSGSPGEAFGEGVSQGRFRKVLEYRLGATVDASRSMANGVDCLIIGANASPAKIQKADCSPTTEIIHAADVLAVLKPDDITEAIRLWRASQTDLAYFEPDDLEFLRGQVVYITGGLGLRGFTKDEDLMRVFDGYGATLCLVRDRRSTANLCVHGDLPTESSNGLDVAREHEIPVVRARDLLALGFGSDAVPPRSAFGKITNVGGRELRRKRARA